MLAAAEEKAGILGLFKAKGWFSPEFIAVAIAFIIVSVAVPYAFFRQSGTNETREEERVFTARNEINNNQQVTKSEKGPQGPRETNKNVNTPIPMSSNDNRQSGKLPESSNANAPRPTESATPDVSGGRLRSGSTSNRGITSLRDVHKLFVDEQENGFKQLVRSAVVKRLTELGFITEVSRADSDARLRLKWEGDNSVRFQIISGNQELLDFKALFDNTTPEQADDLAVRLRDQIKEKLR
jgi:hypothetical protein